VLCEDSANGRFILRIQSCTETVDTKFFVLEIVLKFTALRI
jgi:hypothetical protein